MTPRENLLSAVKKEGYKRLPLSLSLCESQVDRFRNRIGHDDYLEWFGVPTRGVAVELEPGFTDGFALFDREELPESTIFTPWGAGRSKGSAEAFHMRRWHHPLRGEREAREIAEFPMPHIDSDSELERLRNAVREIHGRGLAAVGSSAQTIWETAWIVRGMEDLMVEMMSGDERAAILLDRITEVSVERVRILTTAGIDILHLGDDIGMQQSTMMSIEMWREWLKPRLARVIDTARQVRADIPVYYHSCGFIEPFIPELIEIGVDILNPVQPECMDFADIHARFGDRLSFWGTIGTQSTLPFGTPEDVRRTVRTNADICGSKGGLVIAPTHLVEPEVPWENLVAMRDACLEYGSVVE